MGGFIAQNFASLYKERIKSLTLVASDGGALSEREKTARLNMEALLKKSRYKGIGHKELPRFLSEQSLKDPSIGELIISMSQGFTSEMYINQMKATIDRKDEARAIDQENYPVLIIGAKGDQVVSYENIELWKNFEKRNKRIGFINWTSLGSIIAGTILITLFLILNINTMAKQNTNPQSQPKSQPKGQINPEGKKNDSNKGRTTVNPTFQKPPQKK
jgi:hypothetical protein